MNNQPSLHILLQVSPKKVNSEESMYLYVSPKSNGTKNSRVSTIVWASRKKPNMQKNGLGWLFILVVKIITGSIETFDGVYVELELSTFQHRVRW